MSFAAFLLTESDLSAFVYAYLHDPFNALTLGVAADWFDEQGDEEAAAFFRSAHRFMLGEREVRDEIQSQYNQLTARMSAAGVFLGPDLDSGLRWTSENTRPAVHVRRRSRDGRRRYTTYATMGGVVYDNAGGGWERTADVPREVLIGLMFHQASRVVRAYDNQSKATAHEWAKRAVVSDSLTEPLGDLVRLSEAFVRGRYGVAAARRFAADVTRLLAEFDHWAVHRANSNWGAGKPVLTPDNARAVARAADRLRRYDAGLADRLAAVA